MRDFRRPKTAMTARRRHPQEGQCFRGTDVSLELQPASNDALFTVLALAPAHTARNL